jgi:hypothetical protein
VWLVFIASHFAAVELDNLNSIDSVLFVLPSLKICTEMGEFLVAVMYKPRLYMDD